MRSSTRMADWVRVPLLIVALTLAACSAPAGAAAPTAPLGDHSTDAGENARAAAFDVEDHRSDSVESAKGGAFSH
jgi:hypothetical protein